MNGWIKLHRQIADCVIWEDKPFSKGQAWIDLLLMANHDTKSVLLGNDVVIVEPGSFITSELKLMQRWGWSKEKTRNFLKLLQVNDMIDKKSDHRKTTITIVKWGIYQDTQTDLRPPKDHEETTKRPRGDHEPYTNKKEKNDKKKEIKNIYGEYKHVKLTEEEYSKLGVEYGIDKRDKAIVKLDEYIDEKPSYKSQNHYLCIRRWVVKAVEEDEVKQVKKTKTTFEKMDMKQKYDFELMERELLK